MLRMMSYALVALVASASLAAAQPRSVTIQSPLGQEVRSDDGAVVLGRVAHVSRNHTGRIVAVEVPGMEPADAPRAAPNVVADNTPPPRLRRARDVTAGGIFVEATKN